MAQTEKQIKQKNHQEVWRCHPRGGGDPVSCQIPGFPPPREWREKEL